METTRDVGQHFRHTQLQPDSLPFYVEFYPQRSAMSMQISRVNNAVRSLCSGPSSATTCNVQRHLVTGLSTQLHRQRHQRRQSSSKTSISPAVPPTASPQHDTTGEAPTKTSSSRLNRRRPKNASAVTLKDKDDIPAGLPVVPPTNNLNEHGILYSVLGLWYRVLISVS